MKQEKVAAFLEKVKNQQRSLQAEVVLLNSVVHERNTFSMMEYFMAESYTLNGIAAAKGVILAGAFPNGETYSCRMKFDREKFERENGSVNNYTLHLNGKIKNLETGVLEVYGLPNGEKLFQANCNGEYIVPLKKLCESNNEYLIVMVGNCAEWIDFENGKIEETSADASVSAEKSRQGRVGKSLDKIRLAKG